MHARCSTIMVTDVKLMLALTFPVMSKSQAIFAKLEQNHWGLDRVVDVRPFGGHPIHELFVLSRYHRQYEHVYEKYVAFLGMMTPDASLSKFLRQFSQLGLRSLYGQHIWPKQKGHHNLKNISMPILKLKWKLKCGVPKQICALVYGI